MLSLAGEWDFQVGRVWSRLAVVFPEHLREVLSECCWRGGRCADDFRQRSQFGCQHPKASRGTVSMKKIKPGIEVFFLNLIAMSLIHARGYLKMPLGGALQAFFWECFLESLVVAILFTIIVARLFKKAPKDESSRPNGMR